MKRVLINGFGRMGRLFLRAAWENPAFTVVQVNEISGGAETAAHLLEFDSIHGRWEHDISFTEKELRIDEHSISFSAFAQPSEIPLDDIDVVVECSGKFKTSKALSPYFANGAKKVVVSCPVKDEGTLNVVVGVNDHLYKPELHYLVTAASCTTNCLAPVVKVVLENFGIKHGLITTIHDVTNTQTIIDAPHKDLRRARSSQTSLIPTTTGSATAITLIYPELRGRLNGLAVRVPIMNASLTDCVFELERKTTVEELNAAFQHASENELRGILGFETRPLVSVDYVNDTRSSIIDALSTMVVNETQIKVLAWYDNEVGYVNRMAELTAKVCILGM